MKGSEQQHVDVVAGYTFFEQDFFRASLTENVISKAYLRFVKCKNIKFGT